MIERLYVEIGNICNLSCSFCPKTKRKPRQMTADEFEEILVKSKGLVRYIYLHVMGEPLLHPELDKMLSLAEKYSMPVCITTNGTLLKSRGEILLSHADIVHKVSVSLHAPEGNSMYDLDDYLSSAVSFARAASEAGIFTVLRLWNEDGADADGRNLSNPEIEKFLYSSFEGPYTKRPRGLRLAKYIFLEYGDTFVWPIESEAEERESLYCHALSDQVAILADGTAVPCCLDSEGVMALGNIFESSLADILCGERAVKIKKGFDGGCAEEPLCKKCSYARRFAVRG